MASGDPQARTLWFPLVRRESLAPGAWHRAGGPALPGHVQGEGLQYHGKSTGGLLLPLQSPAIYGEFPYF